MSNVIVFVSDEHNPMFSSVYGHPFIQTPNLERLAEMGVVYDGAYCPSPLCVPSRTAFMTGHWPHQVHTYNNCKVLEGRYPSYGGVLASQGVHSVYVGGGSNLYRDPYALGFSEMLAVARTQKSLEERSIRASGPPGGATRVDAAHGPVRERYARARSDVDRAVEWILGDATRLDRPWTLTVEVNPPHPPYTTEPHYWSMYEGMGDLPSHGADEASAQHPYAQDIRECGGWAYADDLVRSLRRGYFGAVSYVDDEVGRIMDAVERAGLTPDTVMCYTSDHGEMLGKFGLWGKTSLYEDSVRVPLVVAGPGFEKGKRVRTPVSTLDLQAQMFRSTGVDRPADWEGVSLQDVGPDDCERTVFASYHGHNVRDGAYMVRRGPWKLLYNVAAPHQLFNLENDPFELENVWSLAPSVVEDLEEQLRRVCDPMEVARDARRVQQDQLSTVRSLRGQVGQDAAGVPWKQAERSTSAMRR